MSSAPTPINNPLDQQRLVDQAQKHPKDIYSSSIGEIFSKNFIAGFARGLGGVVVYILFLGVVLFIVSRTLLPKLEPLFSTFQDSMNLLQNGTSLPQNGSVPIEQLFERYKQK